MTFTLELVAFVTCTAMINVFHCQADPYPPPSKPSYEWLDMFTVNVSWNKPSGLPDESELLYCAENTNENLGKAPQCVPKRSFTDTLFTKDTDHWIYKIWTVSKECTVSNDSIPVNIIIKTPKPRAELVNDFKCIIGSDGINCSWIPVNPSLNLKLSYRSSKLSEKNKSLKECAQPYSSGGKNGCYLHIGDDLPHDTWILVETESAMSTFVPDLVVRPPKMNIKEEGDNLKVTLTLEKSRVSESGCLKSQICYKQCNKDQGCQNTTSAELEMSVFYDKRCRYEFWSEILTEPEICLTFSSEISGPVFHGTNEPPDRTLMVAAIVIPVILSICVILSCYCFRRHSAIICPIIPDPSAIFKEMMMNGNKELKTTSGNLYKPVPETVEPCKITLVIEKSDPQQKC